MDAKLCDERVNDLSGVISGKGDEDLHVLLAAAKAKGQLCAAQEDRHFDIRKHITIAYAARDVLEILKRLLNPLKQKKGD